MNEQEKENVRQAKAALLDYLAEHYPKIAHITICYDGCGDEGYVNEVHYHDTLRPDAGEIDAKDEQLDELIKQLFWCVAPEGFEINEGGDGEIFVYPATKKVIVHHYQNIVTQEAQTYEV
jgi:hypothetical protein